MLKLEKGYLPPPLPSPSGLNRNQRHNLYNFEVLKLKKKVIQDCNLPPFFVKLNLLQVYFTRVNDDEESLELNKNMVFLQGAPEKKQEAIQILDKFVDQGMSNFNW